MAHFGTHCRCVSPKHDPTDDLKSDMLPDAPATERHNAYDITSGAGEFGLAALGVGSTKHVGWRPVKTWPVTENLPPIDENTINALEISRTI